MDPTGAQKLGQLADQAAEPGLERAADLVGEPEDPAQDGNQGQGAPQGMGQHPVQTGSQPDAGNFRFHHGGADNAVNPFVAGAGDVEDGIFMLV